MVHSFNGTYAIQENMTTHIKRAVRRGRFLTAKVVLPENLQDECCALCINKFAETPEIPIRKTICNHTYHYTCINEYKAKNTYDLKCPICREPLVLESQQ